MSKINLIKTSNNVLWNIFHKILILSVFIHVNNFILSQLRQLPTTYTYKSTQYKNKSYSDNKEHHGPAPLTDAQHEIKWVKNYSETIKTISPFHPKEEQTWSFSQSADLAAWHVPTHTLSTMSTDCDIFIIAGPVQVRRMYAWKQSQASSTKECCVTVSVSCSLTAFSDTKNSIGVSIWSAFSKYQQSGVFPCYFHVFSNKCMVLWRGRQKTYQPVQAQNADCITATHFTVTCQRIISTSYIAQCYRTQVSTINTPAGGGTKRVLRALRWRQT